METNFVKADSGNLPKIDAIMVGLFFKNNPDFYAAELKNLKTARMNGYERQMPFNTYEPAEVNGELILSNEPFRVVFNHGNRQEVYESYFSMTLKCRSRPYEEPTPKAYIMRAVGPRNIQSDNHTIIVKMNGRSGNVFIPDLEYEYDNDDNGNMQRDTDCGGFENVPTVHYTTPVEREQARRFYREHNLPIPNHLLDNPPGHDNAEIHRPTPRGVPSGGPQQAPHGINIQINPRGCYIGNPRGHNNLRRNENQGNPRGHLIQNPRGHPIGGDARGHPIQNPPGHPIGGDARGHPIQNPPGHPIGGDARGHPIQNPPGHPIGGDARGHPIQNPPGHPIGGAARGHPIQNPLGHPIGGDARGHPIQNPPGHPIGGDERGHPIQNPPGHLIEGDARGSPVEHNLRYRYILEYLRNLPNEFDPHDDHVLQDPHGGRGNSNQNDPHGPQNDPRGPQNDPIGPQNDPRGPQNDPRGPQNLENPDGGCEDHGQEYNIVHDPRGHRVLDPQSHELQYIPRFRYLSDGSNQNNSSDGHNLQDPHGGRENLKQNDPPGPQILEDPHDGREDHDQDDDPNHNIRGDPWSYRIFAEQRKKRMQANHRNYNIEDDPRGHPVLNPRTHPALNARGHHPVRNSRGHHPVRNPRGHPGLNPHGHPVLNPRGQPALNPRGHSVLNPRGHSVLNPRGHPVLNPRRHQLQHNNRVPYILRGKLNQYDARDGHFLQDPHVGRGNSNQNDPPGPQILENPHGGREDHDQDDDPYHNLRGDPWCYRILAEQRKKRMQGNHRNYNIEDNPRPSSSMGNPRESQVEEYLAPLENNPRGNNIENYHQDPRSSPVFNIQGDLRCQLQNNSRGSDAQNNQEHRRRFNIQHDRLCTQEQRDARENQDDRRGIRMQDDLCDRHNRNACNGLSAQDLFRALYLPEGLHDGAVETGSCGIQDHTRDNHNPNESREYSFQGNSRDYVIEDGPRNQLIQNQASDRHLENNSQYGIPNGMRSGDTDNGPSTNNIQNTSRGSRTPQKEDGNHVQNNQDIPTAENPQNMPVDDNMLGIVNNEDRNSDNDYEFVQN